MDFSSPAQSTKVKIDKKRETNPLKKRKKCLLQLNWNFSWSSMNRLQSIIWLGCWTPNVKFIQWIKTQSNRRTKNFFLKKDKSCFREGKKTTFLSTGVHVFFFLISFFVTNFFLKNVVIWSNLILLNKQFLYIYVFIYFLLLNYKFLIIY